MKKQFKLELSSLLFVSAMMLSGCSNILYSDTRAPVYPDTRAKRGGVVEPAIVNSTFTPLPQVSTVRGQSIERPSNMSVNTTNNPYSPSTGSSAAVPAPTVRPATVTQTTTIAANRVTPPVTTTITQASQTAGASVNHAANSNAGVIVSTDSRIREATEVLNQPVQTTTSNAVVATSRPSAVATPIVNKATTAAERTTNAVKTTTNNMANTVNKATEAVSRTSEKATTAVETVRKTPKTIAKKTSSATTALLQEASNAVDVGNYDKAASALERAHRIEPGNAKILYDIAQIRYAQGKYSQAESFASKAATLSKSSGLSKKTWSLLSNARKALGNTIGAETAARKAENF